MLTVTKRFEFCYGHSLPGYQGACAREHGHNAVLEVEVAGGPNRYKGMVVDFKDLKRIVNERVIDKLDHQHLNKILKPDNPTAETMVMWIVEQLQSADLDLVRVRCSETPSSWAEWTKTTNTVVRPQKTIGASPPIQNINTSITEGQLLIIALGRLSTTAEFENKHPDEILRDIQQIAAAVYGGDYAGL